MKTKTCDTSIIRYMGNEKEFFERGLMINSEKGHGFKPEIDGVRIPSPMTIEVPMIVTRKSMILAILLFSSISLIF